MSGHPRRSGRSPLLGLFTLLVFAFLYLPIAVLILYSFNRKESAASLPAISPSVGIASFLPTLQSGIPFSIAFSLPSLPSFSLLLSACLRRSLLTAPTSPANLSSAAWCFFR